MHIFDQRFCLDSAPSETGKFGVKLGLVDCPDSAPSETGKTVYDISSNRYMPEKGVHENNLE